MDESVDYLDTAFPAPGSRLGSKYVVGELLGRGAMGVVHAAETLDGRPVAVKFLRPELAADHKTVARFLQERHIFRKIRHPNVVRVHDLVAEGDSLAIVMERVSGGDLKNRIDTASLTARQSMAVAAEVAVGLAAIHGAKVVHRDLKPANILLTDDLVPKISDFGISRLVSEAMTRTSSAIGTPIYMAPEAADHRGADAPADVYALGVMMFELLVGRPPFHEGGTFAVIRAHTMDAPPRVEGVPERLSALIDRMLAKDPEARPTVDAVGRELLELLPDIADHVRPVAVARPTEGRDGFDSSQVTGPPANGTAMIGRPGQSDPSGLVGGAAGAIGAAGAGGLAAASGQTRISGETGTSGDAWASDETRVSGQTFVSGRTHLSGDRALPGGVAPVASPAPGPVAGPGCPLVSADGARPSHSATIISGPLPAGVADAAGVAGASGLGAGLTGFQGPPGPPPAPTPLAGTARRTGGLSAGAILPNRLNRRLVEVVVAVGSLLAVVGVAALILSTGGDDESGGGQAIESNGTSSTVEAAGPGATQVGAPDRDDDGDAASQFGNPGASATDGDDEGSGSESTTRTTSGARSSTPGPSATATTKPPPTSSPSPPPSVTTTQTTVTTTSSSSSSTTSTTVGATPIEIVSGPTVNTKGSTSFQFNYTTNDVCGTGSFTVVEQASGTTVGSFSGADVCYGPLHGGYPQPSHPTFGGFDLTPGTTYTVHVTVRGTASDGSRAAGSGSDSASFSVTTSS
jgi:serine/threonine-protein kinase